jgi:hypothetical protein
MILPAVRPATLAHAAFAEQLQKVMGPMGVVGDCSDVPVIASSGPKLPVDITLSYLTTLWRGENGQTNSAYLVDQGCPQGFRRVSL